MPIAQSFLPSGPAFAGVEPDPFLLAGSVTLGIGLGGLAWVVETRGWRRGLGKFVAVLLTTIGVGMLVMYAVQMEKAPVGAVLVPGIALALLVWGVANPVVGRRLARILAVPALAIGAGFLALAITGLVRGKPPIEDPNAPKVLQEALFTLGLGVAFLTAGGLALGLSFLGSRKREIESAAQKVPG